MNEQDDSEFSKPPIIKGLPELHWPGKSSSRFWQYFPARLRERYGSECVGWINRIYRGDNLYVMDHLLPEFCGKIDLIYIDPPFDSKSDYKKKIELRGNKAQDGMASFEEKQYGDIWTNDSYLQFIYERIILMRELLADTGSIILHCDWHKAHYLRCIMDEIFGPKCFRNEIAWCYGGGGAPKTEYPKKHDQLLWYTKTGKWTFHKQHRPYSEGTFQRGLTAVKGDGYKLDDQGAMLNDWWAEKEVQKILSPTASENLKYPTQKPEGLLKRIISGHSNPGDLVFDCFMGSGTTQAVAMKLGRRFIGADSNPGAIQTAAKRLILLAAELEEGQKVGSETVPLFTGFELYDIDAPCDKADQQSKPSSQADIVIEDSRLIIRTFYPEKLMQKLSRKKEFPAPCDCEMPLATKKIDPNSTLNTQHSTLGLQSSPTGDWRQLVESIIIDWNYDGAVIQPAVIDIPGKKEMVKGTYEIPKTAGIIKIKITDLLSESLETEMAYG